MLRAPDRALRPGGPRPAVPDRRRRLGPAVAASGDASKRAIRRGQPPRHSDERRARHVLRPRRCRLDDAGASARRRRRSPGLSRNAGARPRSICSAPARRSSPTSSAPRSLLKSEVEDGAVGAGRRRPGHRRRLRQPARAHRSAPPRGPRVRPDVTRPRHSAGRWSLLHAGEPPTGRPAFEATCWMLLRRYGVVFRELLARESILPTWRELLMTFRRLEDRGEIRGGRFVSASSASSSRCRSRSSRCARCAARAAISATDHRRRRRSAQPGRHHRPRRSRRRQLGPLHHVQGWCRERGAAKAVAGCYLVTLAKSENLTRRREGMKA